MFKLRSTGSERVGGILGQCPGLGGLVHPLLRRGGNRGLHHRAALLTGPLRLVGPEGFHHRLELFSQVHQLKTGVEDDLPAALAKPAKVVVLALFTAAFDDQPNRIGGTLGRMRDTGGEQEHLALFDRDLLDLAVFDDSNNDISLDLVEEFLAVFDVKILPGIRASDRHDQKLGILPDHLVPDRGFEEIAVFVDPAFQVNWRHYGHGDWLRLFRSTNDRRNGKDSEPGRVAVIRDSIGLIFSALGTRPGIGGDVTGLGVRRLGFAEPVLAVSARRWRGEAVADETERVVEETPVVVVYNRIPHVVMMATPLDLEDFVLGFSITEELITGPADIERIEIVRYSQGIEVQVAVSAACEAIIGSRTRRMTGRTGCGVCGADGVAAVLKTIHRLPEGLTVSPMAIRVALTDLAARQPLNEATGAVHAAGWATATGDLRIVREDVGRHNALDKLVGAVLNQGIDPATGFVVVTSRASFEMVQKTATLGAPLLAAISGPTGLAVRVAEESGLTLVGFARGTNLTAYTRADRIG